MAYAGDVVLIYNDEKPAFFARIDSIKPDIKKGWFVVQFLSLTIPLRRRKVLLKKQQWCLKIREKRSSRLDHPKKRMKKGLEDLCAEMLRYKKLVTLHTLTLR